MCEWTPELKPPQLLTHSPYHLLIPEKAHLFWSADVYFSLRLRLFISLNLNVSLWFYSLTCSSLHPWLKPDSRSCQYHSLPAIKTLIKPPLSALLIVWNNLAPTQHYQISTSNSSRQNRAMRGWKSREINFFSLERERAMRLSVFSVTAPSVQSE